jgi:amino acid transporter
MRDWVFASAWIAGMLAAPYTLVRLGNLAGAFQWGLLPLIALAALVIWLNSADLHLLMKASTQAHDEITPLATAFGPHAAALLLTAGRLMTAVTASTVLLVTSGFAFNETLAHWFPNFGFAFLLLTLVLAAGIGGPKTAGILQVVASSTALIGIVLLIVLGLLAGPYADSANEPGGGPLSWHGLFSALLVFVGFEAALNHRFDHPGTWKRSVQVVIGLFTVTFALWCCIALLAVSPDRLAGTFIPHIIIARSIAGQSGRIIMAVAVIAGSCAAVNALFGMASRSLVQVINYSRPSDRPAGWVGHPAVGILLCGLGVAAMMTTGMAGTDAIDAWVRASLYSWLLCYSAFHCGAWILMAREKLPAHPRNKARSAAGALLMLSSVAVLTAGDPDRLEVLRFVAVAWTAAAALLLLLNYDRLFGK